jgi:hypothetical protein
VTRGRWPGDPVAGAVLDPGTTRAPPQLPAAATLGS